MGRFAFLGKGLSRGLPILGAVGDYADGKAQGEDEIRAGVGAAGSGLGGWGGAAAGAGIGQALIPIPGVGAAIGGIVGGIAGTFAGGWGADRADDLVRGNNNKQNKENKMASFYDSTDPYLREKARREQEQQQYDNRPYGFGDFLGGATNVAAAGTGLYAVGKSARDTNFANPFRTAEDLVRSGISRESASNIATQTLKTQGKNFVKNIPFAGKAALAIGGAKLVDDTLFGGAGQRMLTGAGDAVTGNVFDLDGRGDGRSQQQRWDDDQRRYEAEQRKKVDEENVRRINALPSNDPYLRQMQWINEAAEDKLLRRMDSEYDRKFNDSKFVAERATQIQRENYLTETQAKQASELMNAYSRDIPQGVSTMLNSVFNARY
jgi:hypothetical protein